VTYFLKAITEEPQKWPLLANGSETIFGSNQWPRNNIMMFVARWHIINNNNKIAAAREWLKTRDTHTTIEILLGTVFSS
jgi:hypothetical protein